MEINKISSLTSNENSSDLTVSILSGVVIIEEGKVLLTKDNKDDFWKLPGGKINDSENLIQAAKREALEETGKRVKILNKSPVFYTINKENFIAILIHYFAQFIDNKKLNPIDKKVLEAKMFSLKDLPTDLGINVLPVLYKSGILTN